MYNEEQYREFSERMERRFPEMFRENYGGFAVNAGWWPIIELLCENIQSHLDWRSKQVAQAKKTLPDHAQAIVEIPQVVVHQIKEKFGGLRFYYDGGDDVIDGMVRMAESWAEHSCEICGAPGKTRNIGWVQTLCDFHLAEREATRPRE